MGFLSKVGNILRHTTSRQISHEFSARPAIYQALRFMSSSKVFVGGISYQTDDMSLREAFSKYGEVVEARIIMDRETGRSRGFGFVSYTSSEEASSAIQALDGQDLHGRRIKVNFANDRPRGNFGGGYGAGGGGYGGYGTGGGGYGAGGGGYGTGGGGYGAGGGGYGAGGGGYGAGSGGYNNNYGGTGENYAGGDGGYSGGNVGYGSGNNSDSTSNTAYGTGTWNYGGGGGGGGNFAGGNTNEIGGENYNVAGGGSDNFSGSHISGGYDGNAGLGHSGGNDEFGDREGDDLDVSARGFDQDRDDDDTGDFAKRA